MKDRRSKIFSDKIDKASKIEANLSGSLSSNDKLIYLKNQKDNLIKAMKENRKYLEDVCADKYSSNNKKFKLLSRIGKSKTERFLLSDAGKASKQIHLQMEYIALDESAKYIDRVREEFLSGEYEEKMKKKYRERLIAVVANNALAIIIAAVGGHTSRNFVNGYYPDVRSYYTTLILIAAEIVGTLAFSSMAVVNSTEAGRLKISILCYPTEVEQLKMKPKQ